MTKNRSYLETVVDCCYSELCLKCDKSSRNTLMNLDEGNKVFHLAFTCSDSAKKQVKYIQS